MRSVFADTLYWIAIIRKRDSWHEPAIAAKQRLEASILVTTDEVLSEFLTALRGGGPKLRQQATKMVRAILIDPNVKVLPQSRQSFMSGLDLYGQRPDKHYSLTDCISMNAMTSEGIRDTLTNDRHFEQEGFNILIKRDN